MICGYYFTSTIQEVKQKKTSKGTLKLKYYKLKNIYLDSHKVPFSLIYDYAIQWVIAECNVQ